MSDDALARAETRQTLTATTFVEIVDTLVGDFDVIEVLTVLTSRCIELLDAAAAGILLADTDGPAPGDRCLDRAGPTAGALPDPERRGTVPGLLSLRARRRPRPSRWRVAMAAIRGRMCSCRIPVRVRDPAPAQDGRAGLPEPVHGPTGRRCRRPRSHWLKRWATWRALPSSRIRPSATLPSVRDICSMR